MKLTKRRTLMASLVSSIIVTPPAYANDTSAVLGAGGLELAKSDDIAMVSEDLYLSPSEVRVRYAFQNESRHDVATTVAFPLPTMSQDDMSRMILLPAERENFVDFRVTVDGTLLTPELEEKAISDQGEDLTATVAAAGLPVNARLPAWREKIRALTPDARRQLQTSGLIALAPDSDSSGPDPEYVANWNLRATFHWQQTFPAGSTVKVEHRYKPVVGGVSVFADEGQIKDYESYCLDDQGKAGLRRLLKRKGSGEEAQGSSAISPLEVAYVLTTGANWKGLIGNFRLTIDKEKPDAVLSLCMQGLKKTGKTTFELRKTNFTPTEDIRFVVFKP
ncbi:DUF4424 family protein [Labrys neptuniae]